MNPVTAAPRRFFVGLSRLLTLAAVLAALVCPAQDQRPATSADFRKEKDEIQHLISLYAKAADEADPTLASGVWCNSSEDSLINPAGRWSGVEAILGFYRHEMGDTYSSRTLKITDISVRLYTDAAWAEFGWDFEATRRKDGSAVSLHGMETQIYRNNHASWCLVHVHYSALSAEGRQGQNE